MTTSTHEQIGRMYADVPADYDWGATYPVVRDGRIVAIYDGGPVQHDITGELEDVVLVDDEYAVYQCDANSSEQIIEQASRDWDGDQTIEQAVMEWANCRHAEVHPTGEVYIEDPQAGHYLTAAEMDKLVAWLRARRMIA